jgi:hypothetical protein
MYESIIGPTSGTLVDKLDPSLDLLLSSQDLSDLKHDLIPLLSIVKNEDTDNFVTDESLLTRSPKKPDVLSKGT